MQVEVVTNSNPFLPQSKYNLGSSEALKNILLQSGWTHTFNPLSLKPSWKARLAKLVHKTSFSKKQFLTWADPSTNKKFINTVEKYSLNNSDFLLFPNVIAPLAHYRGNKPTVIWVDSTLSDLLEYYPYLQNVCPESFLNLLEQERTALQKATLIVTSSQWSKNKIIQKGIPNEKILVCPRISPIRPDGLEIDHKLDSKKRFLFVGVEWERKGGPEAVEFVKYLRLLGYNATLDIIGCKPDIPDVSYLRAGGLQPRCEVQFGYYTNHFLLHIPRQDVSAFCIEEANSFGTPVISNKESGISEYSQLSGFNIGDLASKIKPYLDNPDKYRKLANLALENHLNRHKVFKKTISKIEDIVT